MKTTSGKVDAVITPLDILPYNLAWKKYNKSYLPIYKENKFSVAWPEVYHFGGRPLMCLRD